MRRRARYLMTSNFGRKALRNLKSTIKYIVSLAIILGCVSIAAPQFIAHAAVSGGTVGELSADGSGQSTTDNQSADATNVESSDNTAGAATAKSDWKILGLKWYWWLLIVAGVGSGWWIFSLVGNRDKIK